MDLMTQAITAILIFLIATTGFIHYSIKGHLPFEKSVLWLIVRILSVIILPVTYLIGFDRPELQDCCNGGTPFSPEYRVSIYVLILLCMAAFLVAQFHRKLLPPLSEVLLNLFLVMGTVLSGILSYHLRDREFGPYWVVGTLLVTMFFLIELAERHRRIKADFVTGGKPSSSLL